MKKKLKKRNKNKHKKKNKKSIDPNKIKARDQLIVALINGATKCGVHEDKKKQHSRSSCRHRYTSYEEDNQ